jgi:hypothetical protein
MTTLSIAQVETPEIVRAKRWATLLLLFSILAGGQLANAPSSQAMSWQWRWFGGQALLNRGETNRISYGSGAAAAVATAIPDPTLSKIAAVGFGLYTAYAGYTYSVGRCVDFNVTWYGGVYPGSYYDWRCR